MTINSIRGFRDIAKPDIAIWQRVEIEAKKILESFSFKEIRLPIIEKAELFSKSIGEITDIVGKEMYTFPDRKGDLLSLRPEATAGTVRHYIQKKLFVNEPIQKFYTIGPMFRRERPQKGRYRQFYQINAEVFGIESPYIDTLLISMLIELFNKFDIKGLEIKINSLGCSACKPNFNKKLLENIKDKKENLCKDCKTRAYKNPLRVLDCKNPNCQKVLDKTPSIIDFLCENCKNHYNNFKERLKNQNISFSEDKNLVRGLDYYTKTIFEIQTKELGAQSAIAGGGRYDGLIEMLGGKNQPAIGFAIGLDRVCEIISQKEKTIDVVDYYLIALDEKSQKKAFDIFIALGKKNIKVEMDFEKRSLKSFMKKADKLNAKKVIIIGENELKEGKAIVRDMTTKKQTNIIFNKII